MNSNTNKKVVTGVVAVIIAVVIFYGGMKYGQAHAQSTNAFAAGNFQGRAQGANGGTFAGRTGGARANFTNGGVVAGEILSKDATSITVKLQTGGSKIVFTSGTTQVMKQATGSRDDLSVGTNVNVIGTANSDGSITAQSVQIRPAGMFGTSTTFRQR